MKGNMIIAFLIGFLACELLMGFYLDPSHKIICEKVKGSTIVRYTDGNFLIARIASRDAEKVIEECWVKEKPISISCVD